jgi:opacity protein-like surface antigen
MKRLLVIAGFAALSATALLAQQHDMDKMQAGGSLPAGWSVRLDSGSTKPEGVSVVPMGGGIHFRTGPAGIYYRAADAKSGSYEVHASFNQVEPSAHPEAYGLFVGGSDLAGAAQKYTYFLVRQDGKFMISRRNGASVNAVVPWTDSAAVKKTDASMKGTNMLSIVVTPAQTRFLVNGTEVKSVATSSLDGAGIAGMRINHNLNVHVDGFGVK